jgi:hypothetical protein
MFPFWLRCVMFAAGVIACLGGLNLISMAFNGKL